MKKVKLFNSVGEFIINIVIPDSDKLPRAIVWQQRLFLLTLETGIYNEEFYTSGFEVKIDNNNEVEVIEKNEGNDDMLFGLPNNLDEAIESFLGFYSTAKDFNKIKEYTEDDFVINCHNASGQFLRNSWYLWWHEEHGFKTWPKSIPPIVKFFNDKGIIHPDDISAIIIISAYRVANNKEIDLDVQIKHFHDFWKKQGYRDGIPKSQ